MSEQQDHEVLTLFNTQLAPLSNNLSEMLNEHFSHQTERRGCGYTQSTRLISEFVNQAPQQDQDFKDLRIFDGYDSKALKTILNSAKAYNLPIEDWRNLDLIPEVNAFLATANTEDAFAQALQKEVDFQKTLRHIHEKATLEESQLLCQFLEDVILRKDAATTGLPEIKNLIEKPKVGSCPMAENFFLKIAHRRLLRQGNINIFVDQNGEAVMMEKLNMGDNHSCINLKPLIMNGIRLPIGCLFSVNYDPEQVQSRPNKSFKGNVIPISEIDGFWFLRVTTLAISPKNRARAFTTHFKQQVDNGLFSPDSTELSQLLHVAEDQI